MVLELTIHCNTVSRAPAIPIPNELPVRDFVAQIALHDDRPSREFQLENGSSEDPSSSKDEGNRHPRK